MVQEGTVAGRVAGDDKVRRLVRKSIIYKALQAINVYKRRVVIDHISSSQIY